jgi:hypothetical protein
VAADASLPPTAGRPDDRPLLEGSRQASTAIPFVALRYFFSLVGPGWALVGDAGPTWINAGTRHQRRVSRRARARRRDTAARSPFERYWRRDADRLYRMAIDMGSPGYNNPFTRMIYRRQASPTMRGGW